MYFILIWVQGSSQIDLLREHVRTAELMYANFTTFHCLGSNFLTNQDARGDQCDSCAKTLDAIDLINPRCLINKEHKVIAKDSAHMYVKLDEIQPRTEEWIKKSYKAGNWSPNSVINADGELVDSRLKSGLRPSPVTRDLTWGVPVPVSEQDEDQSMKGKVLCTLHFIPSQLSFSLFCRCLVRCPDRLPKYHRELHFGVEEMVVQPRKRPLVPVHGQGQRLLPHHLLPLNTTR